MTYVRYPIIGIFKKGCGSDTPSMSPTLELGITEDSLSLGDFCSNIGLTKTNFLENLTELRRGQLTNGSVFEIFKHIRSERIQWKVIKEKLAIVYPELNEVSTNALCVSFKSVKNKRCSLLKSIGQRRSAFIEFMSASYKLPESKKRTRLTDSGSRAAIDDDTYENALRKRESQFDNFGNEVQEEVFIKMEKEIYSLEDDATLTREKIDRCQEDEPEHQKRNLQSIVIKLWQNKYIC
ncbi:Uncharacterised protein r2_g3896 [Pycnogonum litorale]